jgi:AraC-like DNA-binding protein
MKTPIFNLHDVIILLTIAITLLLALFQWLLSKQKPAAAYFLSAFFLCIGLGALGRLLLWNDYIPLENSGFNILLPYLIGLEQLGKGLLLFLYLLSITRAQPPGLKTLGLHSLVFVGYCLTLLVDGIDATQMRFIFAEGETAPVQHLVWLWDFLKYTPVVYALATLLVVFKYQQQLKDYYSDLEPKGTLWLNVLTLGFAVNWIWSLVVHWSSQFFTETITDTFGILDNYLTFILVNALFFHSLTQAHQLVVTQQKTKESATPSEPAPQVIARIRAGMEEQQLYLTANLNIEDFSRKVGVHYREVSSIINTQFDTNFFEYVNQYRVAKAKTLLRDPNFNHKTILDILLESGFNSKSSFHRFFKRYTGMTAAEFRKQQL